MASNASESTFASTPLVWLITGTSSGLGAALVPAVLARGDRVIATARSLASIAHLADPDRVCVRALDVTAGPTALTAIVAECARVWGRIDVVVNNAGAGLPGLLEEGGSDLLRRQFDVNFFGVMDVISAALPHLRAQRSGTVVIVGSRSAWKPEHPVRRVPLPPPPDRPSLSPPSQGLGAPSAHANLFLADVSPCVPGHYAASKAALHALAGTLAAELAPLNIRVLALAPGAFRTAMYGQAYPAYHTANAIADYDQVRAQSMARFASVSGTERGDPVKAMSALVDVVRGEGVARGKAWPAHGLVLGEDAEQDVRAGCARVVEGVEEWLDVVRGVSFDE
ncbi:hypothetical protein B0H15DRAFT_458313 [Mycena belliarum]|uniref:NAD(P)-binding protein n=1 Tax=Mycena belliarum TaxID=1033014 RepID=A0AAD6UFG2_9AGAR|nr:hypothetical protein B0H15DRAFT_458313 [Mycena belliae]